MTGARASIPVRGASIPLPTFFPSVSSLKTALTPEAYVDLLTGIRAPQFLISAYDYQAPTTQRERIDAALERAESHGTVVLLDSGNYEAYWYRNSSWSVGDFRACARRVQPGLAFSFDLQDPPNDQSSHVKAIVEMSEESQADLAKTTVLPIVHGAPTDLPELVLAVATQLRPLMVAVPERALGDGILMRSRTIARIRAALGNLDTPLHLLGTADPISIALYVATGADSFDGLEWCQTVVRPTDGSLHHFSHFDLVAEPEEIALTDDYIANALLHNLAYFWRWMETVRSHRDFGDLPSFALTQLPSAAAAQFRSTIPEVFG